jgi:hypothetical protein
VKLLLDRGAPIDYMTIHWAVLHQNIEALNALLPLVDADQWNRDSSALVDAVHEASIPMVEALLSKSNVDLSDCLGNGSAVTWALAALVNATTAGRPVVERKSGRKRKPKGPPFGVDVFQRPAVTIRGWDSWFALKRAAKVSHYQLRC